MCQRHLILSFFLKTRGLFVGSKWAVGGWAGEAEEKHGKWKQTKLHCTPLSSPHGLGWDGSGNRVGALGTLAIYLFLPFIITCLFYFPSSPGPLTLLRYALSACTAQRGKNRKEVCVLLLSVASGTSHCASLPCSI